MFILFYVPGTSSDSREGCLVRFMSVNLVKRHGKKTERRREHSVRSTLLEAMRYYNDSRLSIQDLLFVSINKTLKVTGNVYISRKVILMHKSRYSSTYLTKDNNRNIHVYCFRDFT